jgi:hypothetical protein
VATTLDQPATRINIRAAGYFISAVVVAVTAALAFPGLPAGEPMEGMTHYMGLLAANQPWHLLIFMAAFFLGLYSVVFAEGIILLAGYGVAHPVVSQTAKTVYRFAAIAAGIYTAGAFGYLVRWAFWPLSANDGWRGIADIFAVGGYLISAILVVILGMQQAAGRPITKKTLVATAIVIGATLVVAHVAMVLGMMDPAVLGYAGAHK